MNEKTSPQGKSHFLSCLVISQTLDILPFFLDGIVSLLFYREIFFFYAEDEDEDEEGGEGEGEGEEAEEE